MSERDFGDKYQLWYININLLGDRDSAASRLTLPHPIWAPCGNSSAGLRFPSTFSCGTTGFSRSLFARQIPHPTGSQRSSCRPYQPLKPDWRRFLVDSKRTQCPAHLFLKIVSSDFEHPTKNSESLALNVVRTVSHEEHKTEHLLHCSREATNCVDINIQKTAWRGKFCPVFDLFWRLKYFCLQLWCAPLLFRCVTAQNVGEFPASGHLSCRSHKQGAFITSYPGAPWSQTSKSRPVVCIGCRNCCVHSAWKGFLWNDTHLRISNLSQEMNIRRKAALITGKCRSVLRSKIWQLFYFGDKTSSVSVNGRQQTHDRCTRSCGWQWFCTLCCGCILLGLEVPLVLWRC